MLPPNNWAVSEVILIYKFAMKLRKKTSSSGLLPMCAYCIYVHLLCQHVCFGEKRAGSSLQSGHTNDFMLCLFMQCVTPFGEKKPVALLNLGILCDIWEDAWTMIDIFLKSFVSDIGSWEDRNITLAGTSILTVKLHPFILAYFLFFYLFFFLGEWIAPLAGRHCNTEALIWCEICSRHAEKSQETRGSYEVKSTRFFFDWLT